MFKLLFSNRWLALIWVAATLGSVAIFAGEDGAVEHLGDSLKQVTQQQRELAAAASQPMDEPDFSDPIDSEPIAPPAFDPEPADLEGEVFINPETGQKIRIVRRPMPEGYAPDTSF